MKLKTIKNTALFLLIPGIMSIYSCGKKKLENATTSAEDNDVAEAMYDDVFNQSSSANHDADDTLVNKKTGSTLSAFTDPCAVVTVIADTTSSGTWYAKSITIDYGTGCTYNGRTRKGKILITRNGPWFTVGTATTITLESFSIDGYKVEGTKTITTKQATLQLAWPIVTASFDVVVTGGKVTTPEGEALTWASTRNHTWTWETLLGVYLRVTGSASGINRDGVNYVIAITKTLVAKVGCAHIMEGTLEITSDDVNKKITIDYGDGTCDDKATITIGNKKAKELVLK